MRCGAAASAPSGSPSSRATYREGIVTSSTSEGDPSPDGVDRATGAGVALDDRDVSHRPGRSDRAGADGVDEAGEGASPRGPGHGEVGMVGTVLGAVGEAGRSEEHT